VRQTKSERRKNVFGLFNIQREQGGLGLGVAVTCDQRFLSALCPASYGGDREEVGMR